VTAMSQDGNLYGFWMPKGWKALARTWEGLEHVRREAERASAAEPLPSHYVCHVYLLSSLSL